MSEKRVFRKFQIVQGPGFSCKPNIAFFMGYPLYPGSDEMKRTQKKAVHCYLNYTAYFFCFLLPNPTPVKGVPHEKGCIWLTGKTRSLDYLKFTKNAFS